MYAHGTNVSCWSPTNTFMSRAGQPACTAIHPRCRLLSDQWCSRLNKQGNKFRVMPHADCNIGQEGLSLSYTTVYEKDRHTSLIFSMMKTDKNEPENCRVVGLLSLSQRQLLWTRQRTVRYYKRRRAHWLAERLLGSEYSLCSRDQKGSDTSNGFILYSPCLFKVDIFSNITLWGSDASPGATALSLAPSAPSGRFVSSYEVESYSMLIGPPKPEVVCPATWHEGLFMWATPTLLGRGANHPYTRKNNIYSETKRGHWYKGRMQLKKKKVLTTVYHN
jgi:hypothetical protein